MKLIFYLLVVAASIRLGGCTGVAGLQVTLQVSFSQQHRFHLTWEGSQNTLHKVCVSNWPRDCTYVTGTQYTLEEELPSGSVFTFFVMAGGEPEDFSSFVTVFYPQDLVVEVLDFSTIEVSWHPDSSFYIKQVGNVSVDDVTSVQVPGALPVSVLTIEHNLNCGVSDEEMQIPPLALAVDMMPDISGIEVKLLMDYTQNKISFIISWQPAETTDYEVCTSGPWLHCWQVTGHEHRVDESFPSGGVYTFYVMHANTQDFSAYVSVYYPWQLAVIPLTSSKLLVSWDERETPFISQVADVNVTCETSVELEFHGSPANITLFHSLGGMATGSEDNSFVPLNLVVIVPPPAENPYLSLPWKCPDGHMCEPDTQCVPGTFSILPDLDANEEEFPYSCRDGNQTDIKNGLTVSDDKVLSIVHADIVWPDLQTSSNFSCRMSSSFSLMKYSIDGKKAIGNLETLTTYMNLWSAYDFMTDCVPDPSIFPDIQVTWQEVPFDELSCDMGELVNDTCYVYRDEKQSFFEARRGCLALGGDLAFFTPEVNDWLSAEDMTEVMWSLGTSSEARPIKPLAPEYMLTPSVMSVYGAFPCYTFKATSNNSCPSRMASLCALSPQANHTTATGIPSEAPPCEDPNPCLNGGVCYTTFAGLGLAASENATGHMCHCLQGYYGLDCESIGTDGEDYHESKASEIVAPEGNTLSIEYVWYGVQGNVTHCYTPSALTLFQLRCNGRSSCNVPERDLRLQLPSSCPRHLRPQLLVRWSSMRVPGCVKGTDRGAPRGCYALTDQLYTNAQDAKFECNSQGGDLAAHSDPSIFCDLAESSSIWVESSSATDEAHGFSFVVVGGTEQTCPSSQPGMGDSRGMCNFPLIDTSTISSTLKLGLDENTTGVEVSWDEQPGADTYTLCYTTCVNLTGSESPYFWQTLSSGVTHTFTLTPSSDGAPLPRSSISVYHPWQLSVVAGVDASVVVSWEPLDDSFQMLVGSNFYEGESYVVVEDVVGDVFSFLFVNSKDSRVVEVEAYILRRTTTVSFHASPWVVTEGSVQRIVGLNSLLPDINPARAFTFLTSSFEGQAPELEGEDLVSTSGLDITFAELATSSHFDDPEYCGVRSARALVRYACQGKTACSLPKDLLASYTHPPASWENLCSNANATYRLFLRAGEMSGDIECPDLEGLQMSSHTEDRTCYGLTTSRLTFREARELCLSYGGDLLHYHERLSVWLKEAWSGALAAEDKNPWIIGYSSIPRQLKPLVPAHLLHPATLVNGSVKVCQQSNCNLQRRPGICELPPYVPDIRHTNASYNEACTQDTCQNGGTCFTTLPEEQMCSCSASLYGYVCGNKGEKNETFMELSRVYDPDDSYALTAPPGKRIVVEYAMVGRPLSSALEGRQALPSAYRGCYSLHSHHLFERRCNGRSFCQLSARDLRHELETTCPPMITPVVEVRWSFADSVEVCKGEGKYLDPGSGKNGCFLVTSGEHESASAAREECLQRGGDLASASDITELCAIASEFSTETMLWVSADGDFWNSSHYSASIDLPRLLNRVSCTAENTNGTHARGLCVYASYRGEAQKYCKEDEPRPVRYPGYKWSETEAGVVATNECPRGWTGYASRWCNYNGTWDNFLDLSECKSADLSQWEAEADNDNLTASEIMSGVAQDTEEAELAPGDILALGNIIEVLEVKHQHDLSETSSEDALLLAEEYMEGTSTTGDHMLRDPEAWLELDQEARGDTSTKLQVGITSAALALATHLNSFTKSYNKSRINVRVSSQPSEYYEDISKRSFSFGDGVTTIQLPEGFQTSYVEEGGLVPVIFNVYEDLHCTSNLVPCNQTTLNETNHLPAPGQVNSVIIGATVGAHSSWKAEGRERVSVKLRHQYDGADYELGVPRCVWWDEQRSAWNETGCHWVAYTQTYTECSCDHLTNLAVIMDINGVIQKGSTLYLVSQWITILGFSVSIPSLLLSVLCLLGFRSVRARKSSIIHANLCLSLLLAEVVLLAGLDATQNAVVCTVVAALLHYLFLATFTWSAIEAFHMYLNFIKVFSTLASPLKYYLGIGYGVPTLFVSIALGATQTRGYGSERACWLDGNLIWAFAGPLAFVMLSNVVAFAMIMRVVWRDNRVGDLQHRLSRQQLLKRLKGSVSLFLLLGITWITGFFYFAEATSFMAIVFTVLNAFQGLGIFILTVITDNSIKIEIKKLFGKKVEDPKTSYSSRMTTTVVN